MHPNSFLSPFLTSLLLIFLAELGDKTLYTTFVLATQNPPVPVILGGWAAFLAQEVIALFLGSLFGHLPRVWIRWITTAAFLVFGVLLLCKKEKPPDPDAQPRPPHRVALAVFTLVFMAEWGDATQVGSVALIGRFRAPLPVFLGATLGLWLDTVVAVILGRTIGPRVPGKVLRRIAGTLFILFAIVSAIKPF